jgi:hypothetical protein
VALLSFGAVEAFKRGISSLGTDLAQFSTDGALMGMSGGAALGTSQHMGMVVAAARSAFCYSKVNGTYLELGMHLSAIRPDVASNTGLYGKGYDPEVVLNSRGQFVTEMLPLLRQINQYGKAAMVGGGVPTKK